MSIRRSYIVAMENAEHQAEDTAILTEVEDLKIEGEIKDAENQIIEVSAENERVSDAIDEAIDDVEQVEEIQERVAEVGGEQGISAESYAFVQAQANRIFTKYGISQAMPAMESFNGYSGDRKHATKQLTASLEDGKEGIFRKIWNTLVQWATAAYNAVKGFFKKIGDTFSKVWSGLSAKLGERSGAEVEVAPSMATKRRFFTKVDGKQASANDVYAIMKDTTEFFGTVANTRMSVDFMIEQYGVKTESAFGPKDFISETWFDKISNIKGDAKMRKLLGIEEKYTEFEHTKTLIGGSVVYVYGFNKGDKSVIMFDTYTAALEDENTEVKTKLKIDAVRDFGNGLADIKPKFEKFQDEAGKAIAKIKSYESSLRETLGSDKTPHGVSINEVTGMIKRYINATNKVIKLYGDSCSACKAFADEMIDAHDQTLGDKAKAKQDKIDAKKAGAEGAAA